jgi:hypothetical protein
MLGQRQGKRKLAKTMHTRWNESVDKQGEYKGAITAIPDWGSTQAAVPLMPHQEPVPAFLPISTMSFALIKYPRPNLGSAVSQAFTIAGLVAHEFCRDAPRALWAGVFNRLSKSNRTISPLLKRRLPSFKTSAKISDSSSAVEYRPPPPAYISGFEEIG